jgi:alkanesulfonate monooxygenase SsuD/methylene tetrahydromethanopterin reductase-like flavin-dependent oxidoreductase (luciferase family)
MGGGLNGTPDQAVARILEYREAGATGLNVALRAPWDQAALDAYATDVIPAVRAEVGT